jgi:hypothetical protein
VTVLPAVGAIWAALVELLRDRAAHDRAAALQTTQNSLAVGAASHMASVAFEKHAAFCEEYVADIHQALATLFREGPTSEALRHSSSLYRIRQRWAVWLTPSVETDLERFEAALRKIGSSAHFVDVDLAHPTRSEVIREMHELYKEVVGMSQGDEKQVETDRAIRKIIQGLRRVLGIEELTDLRKNLVSRALRDSR